MFVIVLDTQESGPSGRPRISLSRKLVDQESGQVLEKPPDRPPYSGGGHFGPVPIVGEVLRGAVVNIEPFGSFVKLQGYDHQGILAVKLMYTHNNPPPTRLHTCPLLRPSSYIPA